MLQGFAAARGVGRAQPNAEYICMIRSVKFCNECGTRLEEHDQSCSCCGVDASEANSIKLLRRTPPRKGLRDGFQTAMDEDFFELLV